MAVVGQYDLAATCGTAGPPFTDTRTGRTASGRVHECDLGDLSLAWVCFEATVTITVWPPFGKLIVCLPSSAKTCPPDTGPAGTRPLGTTTDEAAATVIGPTSRYSQRKVNLPPHEALLIITVPALPSCTRWRRMPGGGDLDPLRLRLPASRLARAAAYVCSEADRLATRRSPGDLLASVPAADGAHLGDCVADALLADIDKAIGVAAPPAHRVSVNPQLAAEAVAWLREFHHLPLTVENLAVAMRVSPRHIQAVLTTTLGLTFAEVLRGIRLDAARDLVTAEPGTTIGAIAGRVGIAYGGRFSDYFHERFGVFPACACEYARKQLEGAPREHVTRESAP